MWRMVPVTILVLEEFHNVDSVLRSVLDLINSFLFREIWYYIWIYSAFATAEFIEIWVRLWYVQNNRDK